MKMNDPAPGTDRKTLLGGLALISVIVVLGVYFSSRTRELPEMRQPNLPTARTQSVDVGGVRRPASDVSKVGSRTRQQSRDDKLPDERADEPLPYGATPQLDPAASSTLTATFEALNEGAATKHPERVNPFLSPPRFDLQAYRTDPEAYLSIVEPGRVWQSAQPADGVPVIRRISPRKHTLRQGESVRLQVKVAPNAPVTFTAFDLGAFDNGLTSISVAANADGIAEAAYTATPGTIALGNILASSPLASGRTKFQTEVYLAN